MTPACGPVDEACLEASARVANLTLEAATKCDDPRLTVALCKAAQASAPRSRDLIRLAIDASLAMDNPADAAVWARKGLALDPFDPYFLATRARGFELSGEFDLAAVLWRRAGGLTGDATALRLELGHSLIHANAAHDAVAVLRPLLESCGDQPNRAHAVMAGIARTLGEAQLKCGDLAGFRLFEARDRFDGASFDIPGVPLWRGEPLDEKTLLITHHLGFGDQLMLAPLARVFARRAGRIILTCEAPLRELFAASFPTVEVIAGPRPCHIAFPPSTEIAELVAQRHPDYHASLLGAFAQAERAEILEAFAPSLIVPDAARPWGRWQSERLRRRYPGKRLIGLAFDCIQQHLPFNASDQALARRKSVPGDLIERLTLRADVVAAAHFVVLHPPEHRELLGPLPGNCSAPHGAVSGFDQTAALVARLDGLISVDTSVANLAAAMGSPAQVLLSAAGDWRWGENQSHGPWHRHIQIFRQPAPNAWSHVLDAAADQIARGS